jgi:LysM repeat protein
MTALLTLGLIVIQPSKFAVTTNDMSPSSRVYARMSDIDQGQDDAIQFESFVPGGDVWEQITYTVRGGDTLSRIAKNFGTTTRVLEESNNISSADILSPGQKITISYVTDEVIYEIQQESTVSVFSQKYALPVEDVLTLNFLDNPSDILYVWQQVFLSLTREQAKEKWLRQAPVYQKPVGLIEELPEPKSATTTGDKEAENDTGSVMNFFDQEGLKEIIDSISWSSNTADNQQIDSQNEVTWDLTDQMIVDQKIISATDTTNDLEQTERAKKEAERRKEQEALEAKKIAEKALEDQRKAEESAKQEEWKTEPSTRQATESEASPVVEQKVITAQDTTKKIEEVVTCGEDQCLYKGKCYKSPANASCAPEDEDNAWTCNDWYIESRRSCVEERVYEQNTASRWTMPVKSWTISQWYFNPYNDGYSNGRW